MTDDQLANALYGGITERDVEPAREQAPPGNTEDLAQRMYRPDDSSSHLGEDGYDKLHASTQRGIETAMLERAGADPAEARATAGEYAALFRRHDIDAAEAATLTQIGLGVVLGGVEPDPAAWRAQARQALVAEVGATNVEAALDAARELVAQDPQLVDLLDTTGLGDHPRVVVALASRAWRQRR